MAQFRVSPQARTELLEIWLHIAEDSVNNAKRLNTLFYEKFKLLAGMPGIGRSRDDLKTGWRSFPAGSYVIYYRETKTGIEILHIVHGARDLDALLGV